jgi:hypothetical protein
MTVFVPVGGGGLVAGVAAALKQASRHVRVIGVEPELENDLISRLRRAASSGSPDRAEYRRRHRRSSSAIWSPLVQTYVDDIETVSEAEIAQASTPPTSFADREPGGAVGLAAALRAAGVRRFAVAFYAAATSPRSDSSRSNAACRRRSRPGSGCFTFQGVEPVRSPAWWKGGCWGARRSVIMSCSGAQWHQLGSKPNKACPRGARPGAE